MNNSSSQFLNWFASQKFLLFEDKLKLGGLEYFHFRSHFELEDGRPRSSFGSSPDRQTAVLKCAGEALERKVMASFFNSNPELFPKALRTSNGWAVHGTEDVAAARAIDEALQRHLLLRSYFEFGWGGFNFIQELHSEEMTLRLMTARYTAEGKVAAIVAAKSPYHPGVSFGYNLGQVEESHLADFWQPAIFEAADKFLILQDQAATSAISDNWVRREVANFINQDFDWNALPVQSLETTNQSIGVLNIRRFNLTEKWNLTFPLYASFATGTDLLPLFWKSDLCKSGYAYLRPILRRLNLNQIPDWHPIV